MAPGVSHPPILNAISVDVEEYFQVSAFADRIARSSWASLPSRVEASCERVLALFDAQQIHGTFFTLGWIAQRYPQLVRRIAEAGHEVASHGYDHRRASAQSPAEFRADVVRTKRLLEDTTGCTVAGYRAPSFSLDASNLWVWEVLEAAGHTYSSSIYPIHHDHYGLPGAPRQAFKVPGGELREIPVSTVRLGGRTLPCGGGGYFRLLPYAYSAWAVRRINHREQRPAVFYLHPWELDPEQPRQSGLDARTRFRHYTNLRRMEGRLTRLFTAFRWGRIDEVFLGAPCTPAGAELEWIQQRV